MTAASLTTNYALKSMIERHNMPVVLPKAKKPAKTAKSTNSVSEDHHYAIRVQQEEIAAYTPLSAAPANQQIQQNQQTAERQKKILTAFCLIGIFIVILVIIIKIT
jgi:hypothetical protein